MQRITRGSIGARSRATPAVSPVAFSREISRWTSVKFEANNLLGTMPLEGLETYEQIHLSEETLGDNVFYLIPNIKIKVEFYEGNPIGIELPATVEMEVKETEPGLKSATASNVNKPAKMETGLIVQVPPFINTGERIRIDTNEGEYMERVRG